MVEDTWMDDPSHVKNEFRSHFANRFQSPSSNRGTINFLFPNRLNSEQADLLELPITTTEIRNAVWSCGENKSPGPDGFTFDFFRKFWDVIGKDFSLAVMWQILDGPFILNELLSWCKSKKKHAMMFKVDFAKAYDSVRWDFLDDVLRSFGFGSKVVEAGSFKGINFNGSTSISHLFYADDAVFIGEWSRENLFRVMHTLHCFSLLSGLKINIHKSYLLGGRLTLLKSVLGAIPIFWMSLFKALKTVLALLEALRRDFFNGVQDNEKKISWVNWPKVLSAKKSGGLDVSSFFALNRALLFKWVWRFISNDKSLWYHVMLAIHGPNIQ
nr:hypothetical protein [Tanacetum cinerariifolium]